MYSAFFKSLRRSAASTLMLCAATAPPYAQIVSSTLQAPFKAYAPQSRHSGLSAIESRIAVVTPSVLPSMSGPRGSSPVNVNQPFSTFDESLLKAADTLLSLPPTTVPTASQAKIDEPPVALDFRIDRRPRPVFNVGLTFASARVDLLRPTIEPILRNRGVPTDLAAVIVVESGGRSTALSPKGARGLWQLMPDTARRYGLRVDHFQDDRVDLFKSTDAAARYLHDLYAQFGDWKLALAAYNTGEANVGAAILKAHTQDFDQLTNLGMLPLETRNYVPRALAAVRSLGQSSTFGEAHPTTPAITLFAATSP